MEHILDEQPDEPTQLAVYEAQRYTSDRLPDPFPRTVNQALHEWTKIIQQNADSLRHNTR